jgi:hypothetical protein
VNVDVPSSDGTSKFVFAPLGEKYQTTIAGTQVGQIMNIYINFNHIINIIDGNGDPKNQTTLIKFFEILCNDLSVALGSINTFRPFIDKTTNTLKIIDEAKIPNKNDILKALGKPTPILDPELKVYGYEFTKNNQTQVVDSLAGFVREFKLVTQLPPNFASIITIGAQSQGAVVGEDATALSRLNRGLEDRIKPEVINAASVTEPENKTQPIEEKFPDASKNFYEFITKIGIDPTNPPGQDITKGPFLIEEQLYSYTNFAATYYKYLESRASIEQGTASGTIGFIPVGVGLTLDGIAGLKIYNALKVDTRYLPSNYPNTMEFIITGLSHKVESNVWTTELQTIMQPTILADVKAIVPEFTDRQPADTTCGPSVTNPNIQGTNAPFDNRRLNSMGTSYNAIFNSRPNGDAALCARYTYNLAYKYIKSLLNQTTPDENLTPSRGNANDVAYWGNLSKLGYTQIVLGENLTKEEAIALINGLQYNVGDVVSYKAKQPNGGNPAESSFIYGHTQIYTGTGITPSGWSSSKPNNYGTSFVYNSKPWNCYKVVLHRAPDILGRTQSGSPSPLPTPTLNPGTAAVLSQFAQQQNQ